MPFGRSGARALMVALVLTLGACGTGTEEVPLENFSAEDIFKRGELELETGGRDNQAIRYFQEVERLYPYTEFAKRALIMQAFALHQDKEYEQARA
ncbi:MAG: outer membrane protein assembly factor BamD, partial [Paracoccaceae bacterium]